MPAVAEAHETSQLFVPPSLHHAALLATQQAVSPAAELPSSQKHPHNSSVTAARGISPAQRDSPNPFSARGNLAVPI